MSSHAGGGTLIRADELGSTVRSRVLARAALARAVDLRLLALYGENKLAGTIHTCIGQEFTGAALAEHLRDGDSVFSTHRCHGHFLGWKDDVDGLVAELMGKAAGVCGGVGGSQHLHSSGFYSSGIQGGVLPSAAGVALASTLDGASRLAVGILGDGTLGEGLVYETFNLASLWRLPVLFVLEDNGYAQSTPKATNLAGDIQGRARAFGLRVWQASTWQWEALVDVLGEATAAARNREPGLVVIDTYRLKGHSKGDDTRERAEVEQFEARDPLTIALSSDELRAAQQTIDVRLDEAVRRAEAAGPAAYPESAAAASSVAWQPVTLPATRVLPSLNAALHRAMASNDRVIVIGEDIEDPYGGAFKVTAGLSTAFPGRVRNTPISEACIVGTGVGLALAGYRPIVEIMFGDFSGLAFDQIVNHAAKFEEMYRLDRRLDIIVRTPMGGRRGYGPTHSQTLDRHFLGVPGLTVLALQTLVDPGAVYDVCARESFGPVLMIENKQLYGAQLSAVPAGFELLHSSEPLPTAWLRAGTDRVDVTLVGYGGMTPALVEAAERLFELHELTVDVIAPTRIFPFDAAALAEPLNRTRALVLVEEGQDFAGFSAEAGLQMASLHPVLAGRLARVGPRASIIPASATLERATLPWVDDIVAAAARVAA